MIIFVLYIAPIIFTLLIAAKGFTSFLKQLREYSKSETDKTPLINKHARAFNMPIDELKKLSPVVIHQLLVLVKAVAFVYMFPIAMLRLAISMRWGSRVLWRSPINLYDLWRISSISLSYYYANRGNFYTAMTLAVVVGNSALYELLSTLEQKDGILHILRIPRHKVNVRGFIETGLILILSFAAIYYIISLANPNSFSRQLTILDSIYFSVITIATVGYGDIIPFTGYAKIITIVQVLLGLLYILFVVGVFLSVYIRNQEQEINQKDNRA